MDNIDLSILAFLQRDSRKPYTEIAQELDISEGTVRNRVNRLVADGVIQLVGLVDPQKLGFEAPAMIGLSVQDADLETVSAQVAEFPEVSYLIMVSGEYDLIVEVFCRDRHHLANFLNQSLRKVPGVVRTQTFMILAIHKMSYGAPPVLAPRSQQ